MVKKLKMYHNFILNFNKITKLFIIYSTTINKIFAMCNKLIRFSIKDYLENEIFAS